MPSPFQVPLLTKYEKIMLKMLKDGFPNYHILAQVSFGALLDAQKLPMRNSFNRKIADFVILDEALEVLCIIELDDYTHLIKKEQDHKRDVMLQKAGYQTLRYYHVPNMKQVQTDLKKLLKKRKYKAKNKQETSSKTEIFIILSLLIFIAGYIGFKWLL